ncbi:hypothetical protein HGH93_12130 [Chitinophaga polysaccharea]|uniref:hypothetical protein n=1 Tax=Chitinophaga polysaccharea TaxID=1293035 RepID=UPI00145531A2|nr:hypothetical protein [Chitinophaga polysaccharea]NLR58855.1 hypothetical protein [Chitinophaga polysaccharea]
MQEEPNSSLIRIFPADILNVYDLYEMYDRTQAIMRNNIAIELGWSIPTFYRRIRKMDLNRVEQRVFAKIAAVLSTDCNEATSLFEQKLIVRHML